MGLVKDVEAYIGYLKKQHSLYVSLHPAAGEKFISTSSLIACNLHANPYCLYLKASAPLW